MTLINYNKFSIYHKNNKIADVELNPNGELGTVKVKQYNEGWLRQFNKKDEDITQEDLLLWLEYRTFPQERFGVKELLKGIGLRNYSRLDIIRKTHAVLSSDNIWIKFEGEELTFDDILKIKD